MKKLHPNYIQSALTGRSFYTHAGVQTFEIRNKEVLTSAASLIPVITGSELDAFPRHPKYQHVIWIEKLLEVTRSMMI